MESISATPETALELIRRASELYALAAELNAQAIALVSGLVMTPDLETLRAALGNVNERMTDLSAGLRAKKTAAGAFADARAAGEEEGFERGFERGLREGRRERQAGRRSAAHLAIVDRAAG